jgi:hypothetical protein
MRSWSISRVAWICACLCSCRNGGLVPQAEGDASAPTGGSQSDVSVGPDVGPSETTCRPTSGTRLRARFLSTTEGVQIFTGWFDKHHAVNCAFTRAADGRLRCLPDAAVSGVNSYYDPECRRPAVLVGTCADARYLVIRQAAACDAIAVHRVGGALPAGTVQYRREGERCVSIGPQTGLRDIDEVPLTDFAEGREEPGLSGRITAPVLTGVDGSRQPCGLPRDPLFDRERNESCEILATREGKWHCLPIDVAHENSDRYADAMCAGFSAMSTTGDGCREPLYARRRVAIVPSDLCAVRYVSGIARLTPLMGPGWRYTVSGGLQCIPAAGETGKKYWAIGVGIPDSAFAEAAPVEVPPMGRLRARYWELPGGHRQHTGEFVDSQRKQVCVPGPAMDGKLRCLPGAVEPTIRTLYQDPACTQEVRTVVADNCSQVAGALEAVRSGCALTYRVLPVVGPVRSALFEKSVTGCARFSGAASVPNQDLLLGAEIPADAFAELTEAVE